MKTIISFLMAGLLIWGAVTGCGSGETTDEHNQLTIATSAEWMERSDGLPGFQKHYGFTFSDLAVVELGLTYQAVGTGMTHIGVGDATEGRIAQYDLVVLEDDKRFFPAYNPAPLVRAEILNIYPELTDIMKELSSGLDLKTLIMLNNEVSVNEVMPQKAAMEYLVDQGLINTNPTKPDEEKDRPVVVSSKTFTEALTLGYLTKYLLEDRGFEVVDEIGLGEVAVITPALTSGRIDIYWEYTGTGLMNVMGHDEIVTDPDQCFELVKDWYQENHDVVWLDYAPANNTYVLFTSREYHDKYGWSTISDLAAYATDSP